MRVAHPLPGRAQCPSSACSPRKQLLTSPPFLSKKISIDHYANLTTPPCPGQQRRGGIDDLLTGKMDPVFPPSQPAVRGEDEGSLNTSVCPLSP